MKEPAGQPKLEQAAQQIGHEKYCNCLIYCDIVYSIKTSITAMHHFELHHVVTVGNFKSVQNGTNYTHAALHKKFFMWLITGMSNC